MARIFPEMVKVHITMTPEVSAIFDKAKRDIDLMTPVMKTSIRYYDCLAEFEAYCGEYADAWEDAVRAFKHARMDAT